MKQSNKFVKDLLVHLVQKGLRKVVVERYEKQNMCFVPMSVEVAFPYIVWEDAFLPLLKCVINENEKHGFSYKVFATLVDGTTLSIISEPERFVGGVHDHLFLSLSRNTSKSMTGMQNFEHYEASVSIRDESPIHNRCTLSERATSLGISHLVRAEDYSVRHSKWLFELLDVFFHSVLDNEKKAVFPEKVGNFKTWL